MGLPLQKRDASHLRLLRYTSVSEQKDEYRFPETMHTTGDYQIQCPQSRQS